MLTSSGKNGYRLGTILTISFFAHLLVHTYMLAFPLLMPVLIDEFSTTYFVMGAVYTASNIAFGIGAIAAGYLVDWIGSRKVIIVCSGGMALASLLAGLSKDLTSLALSLFLLGLFASLYHPASFSLISKATGRRGKAFGIHGVGGSLGLSVAPIMVLPLAIEWGWRWSFILLSIPGLVLAVIIIIAPLWEETTRREKHHRQIRDLFSRGFVLTLTLYACYGLAFQGVVGFLPSFLTEEIGLVLGGVLGSVAILSMGIPGQLVGGELTDRLGTIRFALIAFGVLTVVLISIAFLPAPLAILSTFTAGFLIFCTQPTTGTLLAEESDREIRGLAYGFAFMANFGIGALGTTVGGFIAATTGSLSFIFPGMAFFILLGVIVALLLKKYRRGN